LATLNGSLFCFSETLLNLWKQNTKQMKETNFSYLENGEVGIIQIDGDRVVQLGLTIEQSKMLQIFLASISQSSPIVKMGEEHDLTLKHKAKKTKPKKP